MVIQKVVKISVVIASFAPRRRGSSSSFAQEFVYLLHIPKTGGQSLFRDLPAAVNCSHVLPRFGYDRSDKAPNYYNEVASSTAGRRVGRRRRRALLSVGKRRPKPNVRWAPDVYQDEMAGLLKNEGYDRDGCNLYHAEGVWDVAFDFVTVAPLHRPAKVVTMLREPTAHVISLYEHNRHSGFNARRMTFTNFAQPTLEQWLEIAIARNTTSLGTLHNPLNMQTTRLSGERGKRPRTKLGVYPRKTELYRDELRADLEVALRRVRDEAWFVGVTEFYRESLCLLREAALGVLAPECRCGHFVATTHSSLSEVSTAASRDEATTPTPPANNNFFLTETHNRHHARYDDRTYTGTELKLIAEATRLDRLVYGAALDRFTHQLFDAEQRRGGAHILCRDGTTKLRLRPAEPGRRRRRR